MSIVSWKANLGHKQANGLIDVRFEFTDSNGDTHYKGSKHYPRNMDFDAEAERLAVIKSAQLIDEESSSYVNDLRDDINPKHQTKLEAQKAALKLILQQERLEDVLPMLGSVAFIRSKSDEQIKAALEINDTQLAKLRAWQAEMEIVHAIDKNYEALL